MQLSDFDYNLPQDLIANSHAEPRDHSRLLVYDRGNEVIKHQHFYDIVDYLQKGDVLVVNNTKVFKARIFGRKETGGKIELLVIRNIEANIWEAMIGGKVGLGERIFFGVHSGSTQEHGANDLTKISAEILDKNERVAKIRFDVSSEDLLRYLDREGELPLPPYIDNQENKKTKKQKNNRFYQTAYARNTGSVAAPTAGFHFTPELLEKIKNKGVEILEITLHVGPGTFLPVKSENIEDHKMHEEFFEVKQETWDEISLAKKEGRRVIAVGTTTCRTLEALADQQARDLRVVPHSSATNIFIHPPFKFQIVDGLITNFHLPKSTLMMLVAAFLSPESADGIAKIRELYDLAVAEEYRFYSFGDSMLIL